MATPKDRPLIDLQAAALLAGCSLVAVLTLVMFRATGFVEDAIDRSGVGCCNDEFAGWYVVVAWVLPALIAVLLAATDVSIGPAVLWPATASAWIGIGYALVLVPIQLDPFNQGDFGGIFVISLVSWVIGVILSVCSVLAIRTFKRWVRETGPI